MFSNDEASNETGSAQQTGRVRSRFRRWLLPCAAILASGLAIAVWYLLRPLPSPRISGYTQITHDGHQKYLGGTDGTRLYLGSYAPLLVAQIPVTGGEALPIPVAVPTWVDLWDVSPDGSHLLLSRNEDKTIYKILWIVEALGGSARRVGPARSAAFSPDGKTIAYSTPEGGIYLIESDGTGARKLVSAPTETWEVANQYSDSIVWSPDGKSLRIVRYNVFWEVTSSGTNIHPVIPPSPYANWKGFGRWTANGHLFVFLAGDPSSGRPEIWALDEQRGLFRRPSASPIRLTLGPTLWGPPIPGRDGKTIFADGRSQRGELLRLNMRTKDFQPFLGGISARNVTFSRDGKSVAYVSYPEGALWKANTDGSNPVRLSDPPINAFLPRWSPDGTRILFVDIASFRSDIYITPSQGSVPQRLFPEAKDSRSDADWSADGARIVFDSPGGWNAKSVVQMLDTITNQVSTLPGSLGLFSPRWSPDGRFIAAISALDSTSLSIFDIKTQRWSKIIDKFTIWYPEWSRDSKFIYFSNDQGIFRVRAGGGEPERIFDLMGWHWVQTGSGLDPTDAPLILRDVGTDDIYALTLEER